MLTASQFMNKIQLKCKTEVIVLPGQTCPPSFNLDVGNKLFHADQSKTDFFSQLFCMQCS